MKKNKQAFYKTGITKDQPLTMPGTYGVRNRLRQQQKIENNK
tara:strand:+ start:3155 stop:3280 length:126 start_codon:yes stop_codon:yes gene_type:complete